jgi:hypothetical protein
MAITFQRENVVINNLAIKRADFMHSRSLVTFDDCILNLSLAVLTIIEGLGPLYGEIDM